jgi:hypothetical protein
MNEWEGHRCRNAFPQRSCRLQNDMNIAKIIGEKNCEYPLSLVGTTEELFERKSSGSGLEIREYCHMDPSR